MYNPNVCTPTMFEDELRALTTARFSDPELDRREAAVIELRKAIEAVREIPGWSGDSVGSAKGLLDRMEGNANRIKTELNAMRVRLNTATATVSGEAATALSKLPSASADGFLADAGRNLSGITDGWGALDTGELVAQEEAKLAAERETAAMNELKTIRASLTMHATNQFEKAPGVVNADTTSVPLPVIDVEGIDSRVPPVGSNGPSGGPGTSPGGTGVGSVAPPQVGTWVPGGGGDGGWVNGGNGGSGGGNTGTIGDNGWDNGDNGGSGGNGGSDPTVDSPNGGTLPGYPGIGIGGGGGGGGLLAGGSGGSGTLGAAVVGGAGAAALMGARSASLNGAGGAGLFGGGGSGAGAGAATAGRGLLGMGGATGPGGLGAAGSASGSATGAAGGTAAGAGGRSMAPGMMGGAAGDDEKRRDRSGLGGPIAPKLEDDEEVGPRSRSAQAGSRDTLR
ncbi:hypothetical protein [Microbacterium sp. Leaf320]|uniref:hypothetical protein n=1 Tax=Microbacterium sp. Leaf320 TaxID=1736334 RepID=UPI000A8E2B55|nr:hypothetical protein [Microbacterium sp. Leaf320]